MTFQRIYRPALFSLVAIASTLSIGYVSGCGTSGATAVLGCTTTEFTPNYADFVGVSRLRHWGVFPVKVFFRNEVDIDRGNGQTTHISDRVKEGIQAWMNSVVGVSWTEVNTESQADIKVQIQVLAAEPGPGDELGVTTVSFDPGTNELSTADMVINTWNGMNLTNVDVDIPQTSAHEFGHALGIGGHSNDEDDLMYPSAASGTVTNITTADRNTLKTAYCGTFPTAQVRARSYKNLVQETIVRTKDGCTVVPSPQLTRANAPQGTTTIRVAR